MASPLLPPLGVMTAGLCLLLALFLWVTPGPLKSANRFLAGFLLLTGLDVIGWASTLLPVSLRELMMYRAPLAFLQDPLLYAYIVSLCFPGSRVRPFLLAGLALAGTMMLALLWAGALSDGRAATVSVARIGSLLLHVQYYVYLALMVRVLLRYRRAYRDTCSNPDSATFGWLATLLAVSAFANFFVLQKTLAWWSGDIALYRLLDPVVASFATVITCAFTLTALTRQHLFLGVPADTESAADAAPAPPDPAVAVVAPQSASLTAVGEPAPAVSTDPAALARLEAFMAAQEPFLDPTLTIRSLARRLGWGQRELSQLLNQQLGVHFFDFINRHRVAKAAELLRDPALRDLTVLDIAHRAGFNTKSSFNTAFARHQGTTPTAYRREADATASPPLRPTP